MYTTLIAGAVPYHAEPSFGTRHEILQLPGVLAADGLQLSLSPALSSTEGSRPAESYASSSVLAHIQWLVDAGTQKPLCFNQDNYKGSSKELPMPSIEALRLHHSVASPSGQFCFLH